MIDMKPTILHALRSNEVLVSLLGRDKDGNVRVYPQVSPYSADSYVTFFEVTNFDSGFANDIPFCSEVHFQVDIWSKGNTGPIAIAVNESMEWLRFYRRSAHDLYERETETFHKVLRYSKIHFGG